MFIVENSAVGASSFEADGSERRGGDQVRRAGNLAAGKTARAGYLSRLYLQIRAPRAGHALLTRGCQRWRSAASPLVGRGRRRAPHVPGGHRPGASGSRQGRKWRWRPVMFVDKGNHTVSHIWCSDLPVVVGLSPAGRVSHPPPRRASLLVDSCAAAPHRGRPGKQRALSSTAEAPPARRRRCCSPPLLGASLRVLCFGRRRTWISSSRCVGPVRRPDTSYCAGRRHGRRLKSSVRLPRRRGQQPAEGGAPRRPSVAAASICNVPQ